MVSQEEFSGILLQAVDRALLSLGETARYAVYLYVGNNCQIKKEAIPDRIEGFQKALGSLLGAGTRVVEMLIAQNLYREMGLNFVRREDWTLTDHIKHASKQNVVRLATQSDHTDF
jgi:hypothetical protein